MDPPLTVCHVVDCGKIVVLEFLFRFMVYCVVSFYCSPSLRDNWQWSLYLFLS